ncbi:MAG: autophagy-related protein 22-like protein [Linnemannia elongata]|nr:MAG: autophagy-related protein 22-like protein [Linnemannia elongata]
MNYQAKVVPSNFSVSAMELAQLEKKQQFQKVHPLKKSELWAWYIQCSTYVAYGWVGAWLLVPLLIQDMASKYGVEASNHAIPCNTTAPVIRCVTPFLGTYIDPGAISLYVSSLSSILSFFTSLSISAVADHGSYKKSLLIVFSVLGCLFTMGFFIMQKPSLFWIGAILSPLAWTCYNVCGVFSHSFLPIYGHAHPDVLAAQARGESLSVVRKIEEQVFNDLSAYSGAIANIGSIIVHGDCIGVSLGMHETSLSLQIAIAYTGVWWLMWILIVAPWLDARPGPPMPKGQNWVATLLSFKQLPEIFKFMVAWFILSDGINTMPAIMFIILYRELSFTHVESLIMSVLLSLMACLGAYGFMYLRKIWSLTTKFMVIMCLSLYGIQMAYLVVVPYFTDKAGLRTSHEGWFHVLYYGIIVSTFYGSCRVMLSELCPSGNENEWFSLYLLADKGSSWMGPFITGAIFSLTGDYRRAFWFPLTLIFVGVLMLSRVDMNKGKDQARNFAQAKERHLAATTYPSH